MTRLLTPVGRGFIVVALLIAGLFVSIQQPVLAKATTIEVTGVSDVHGCVLGGAIVPDEEGNLHVQNYTQTGRFALQGDGIDIRGTQILVLTGILDATGSGFIEGSWIVISEVGTVIWEGSTHGHVEQLSFTGEITGRGKGPYTGMKLTLDVQEIPAAPDNPNPEAFDLSGYILAPHAS